MGRFATKPHAVNRYVRKGLGTRLTSGHFSVQVRPIISLLSMVLREGVGGVVDLGSGIAVGGRVLVDNGVDVGSAIMVGTAEKRLKIKITD